jgi:hypothetical protein
VKSRLTLIASSVVCVAALAACGGGGTVPTAPAGQTAGASLPGATSGATDGGTTPTADPGTAIDTCSLLTAAAINTATGKVYGEGVDDGYGQCVWRVGGAAANNGDGQIVVAVVDSPVSTLKSMFTGGTDLTVGDKAAYWNPNAGTQTLWVDLGGRSLALSFDPVTAETQAVAAAIALVAIGNL